MKKPWICCAVETEGCCFLQDDVGGTMEEEMKKLWSSCEAETGACEFSQDEMGREMEEETNILRNCCGEKIALPARWEQYRYCQRTQKGLCDELENRLM